MTFTNPGYFTFDIEADPHAIAANIIGELQETNEDFAPVEGSFTHRLISAIASELGAVAEIAASTRQEIFRRIGEIEGVYRLPSYPATSTITITTSDLSGVTIPAGTLFTASTAQGDLLGFSLTNDAVIATGQTSVGGCLVSAETDGYIGNGISGELQPAESLVVIDTVEFDAATSGGKDEETDEDYLVRLAIKRSLALDHPVFADEAALLALTVPGIGGAVGVNLLNPGVSTTAQRHYSVFLRGVDGNPVSNIKLAEVNTLLQARREVNMVVHVLNSENVNVTVEASVASLDTSPEGKAACEEEVNFAIESFFEKLAWGRTQFGDPGSGAAAFYQPETTVRLSKLTRAIQNVGLVDFVDVSTIKIDGVNDDFVMAGYMPIPVLTTATVTVL